MPQFTGDRTRGIYRYNGEDSLVRFRCSIFLIKEKFIDRKLVKEGGLLGKVTG